MLRSRLFGALALLALNSALSGCTLIGYGLGSAIDASSKRTFAPEAFAPEDGGSNTFRPGTKLKLALRDGEVVEGVYLGVERLPGDEYARIYGEARERYALQSQLPEPGDSVTLALVTGGVAEGEFIGFEFPHWVFFKRDTQHGVPATQYGVPVTDVVEMSDGRDRSVSGETLDRLLSSGTVPTMSALALQVDTGRFWRTDRRLIPLESIQSGTHNPNSGLMAGGLLGLALDAAVTTAVVASLPTFPDYGSVLVPGGG
jgi:hypothetical protein